MRPSFAATFGPWALVAGASEGIGAAFATEIAARGLNIALVARRREPLEALAGHLARIYRVEPLPIVADLTAPDFLDTLQSELGHREVNLVVANAALSLLGPFLDQPLAMHQRELDLNCRAPLTLAHAFGAEMCR